MSKQSNMSFLEHLEVLRWHIIRSFVAIFLIAIVAFLHPDLMFDQIILAPQHPDFFTNRWLCELGKILNMQDLCINQQLLTLTNITMSGQFTTHVWVSLIAGMIVASPYIFWEIWQFIKPALNKNEITQSRGAILIVSLLFIAGVLFGYFIIAPMSIEFLGHYQISSQVTNQITLTSYISTICSIVLASGISFELPVFIWFLAKIGLVSSKFLKHYRRHAILLIVIFAAVITPPDVVSQMMVGIPMIVLYEVSIGIAKRMESIRKQ